MELITSNLHTERMKCSANFQMTLEEDKNISDRNPDAVNILLEKGRIILDETRPGKEQVSVKGRLSYEVLYTSDEEGRLYRVQGEIPFEEKIRTEGMDSMDIPEVRADIEDLRSSLINSRKINIRAIVNLCVRAKELYDEEIVTEVLGVPGIEVRKETHMQSAVAVEQKDVFRIKEDLELPASYPEMKEVLWKFLELTKWEVRPLEGSLGLQGEVRLFVLYESGGELPQLKAYETTIPFSGNVECPNSSNCMLADVTPTLGSWEITVKPDYDGEERVLDVEAVLDLPIQMYEKKEIELITDAYAISHEVTPVYAAGTGRCMWDKIQARVKLVQEINAPGSSRILQICFVSPKVTIEEWNMTPEGLEIEGSVQTTVLYVTEDEMKPYETLREELPFTYLAEQARGGEHSCWRVTPMVEQCSGILLDETGMEVKLTLNLEIQGCEQWQQPYLKELKLEPMEPEKWNNMPGIVVYIPEHRETLWEIGKKYSTPVESIRSLNGITGETVEEGQKLLLVKEIKYN